jgi:DNA-binding response OmpR family regulator
VKILVVDDDPQILNALTIGFRLQWPSSTVIPAGDATSGLRLFFEHEPDVVLLDVGMPDRNGYEVLEEIRRVSDTPVIMLTARGEETDQVHGLELGADDYVVKPFGHLALVARIKAVLRRAEPSSRMPLADFVAGDLAVDFRTRQVALRGQPVKLTPVEYKILEHLVRNAGRLVPHETLITRALGHQDGPAGDYLKVFISRLRSKIERADQRYIETERGIGYRFVRPTPAQRPG